jgi:hypothetical protein
VEHEDPLDALIELERARLAAIAPEWEEVVTGQLSADEAERRVRARGSHDDEQIARSRALFEPLSTAFEASLIERLVPTAPILLSAIAGELAPPPASPAEVIDRRDPASWRRPAVVAGITTAAAAALALWWVRPNPPAPQSIDTAAVLGPALPMHELALTGVAEVRGSGDATPSVPAGATLDFTLRPATGYQLTPTVWACLSHDGVAQPIEISTERAPPGQTILGHAPIGAELAKGRWELTAVITSRTVSPSERRCDLPASRDVQVIRAPFEIR